MSDRELTCRFSPDMADELAEVKKFEVRLVIGSWEKVVYEEVEIQGSPNVLVIGTAAAVIAVLVAFVLVMWCVRRRNRKKARNLENQERLLRDKEEKDAIKEGARELMKTMGGGVGNDSPYHTIQPSGPGPVCLPFRTYNSFVLHVMFPSSHPGYESFRQKLMGGTGNTLSSSYRLNQSGGSSATMERNGQMISFLKMLGQKEFMHVLVRTLEKQPSFTMNDRNNVAAFIMIALQDRLDYGTVILQYLMVDMIENSRPDQLNTLMRQSTSICEKMLSFWFTMLMHRTLFERTGNYLYQLFTAVRHITYSGAVDQISGHASNTLSEQFLLRVNHNADEIHLDVKHNESSDTEETAKVTVLYCDTVDQVKMKILLKLYGDIPYTNSGKIDEYELEFHDPGTSDLGNRVRKMRNVDANSHMDGQFRKLNTMEHYAKLFNPQCKKPTLIPKGHPQPYIKLQSKSLAHGYSSTLPRMNQSGSTVAESASLLRSNTPSMKKEYHLTRPDVNEHMAREVFLPRFMATEKKLRGSSHPLMESIFSAFQGPYGPPMPIKYMFDFLDEQAQRISHQRQLNDDVNLAHIWKSNCLPLRFWVNLITNPDFLFDVEKPPAVDHTLKSVAQKLIWACSTHSAPSFLNKESTNKEDPQRLIMVNDVAEVQGWVQNYYDEIQRLPPQETTEFTQFLNDESELHQGEFNTKAAISELWSYVKQYYDQLRMALETDPEAKKFQLAAALERIEKGQYGFSANSSHASEPYSSMYNHSGYSHYNSASNVRAPPPPPPPPRPTADNEYHPVAKPRNRHQHYHHHHH